MTTRLVDSGWSREIAEALQGGRRAPGDAHRLRPPTAALTTVRPARTRAKMKRWT
jgi:hypothetical protein